MGRLPTGDSTGRAECLLIFSLESRSLSASRSKSKAFEEKAWWNRPRTGRSIKTAHWVVAIEWMFSSPGYDVDLHCYFECSILVQLSITPAVRFPVVLIFGKPYMCLWNELITDCPQESRSA